MLISAHGHQDHRSRRRRVQNGSSPFGGSERGSMPGCRQLRRRFSARRTDGRLFAAGGRPARCRRGAVVVNRGCPGGSARLAPVADISRPLDPRHRSSHQGKHHRHHQVSARDPKANRDRHTRRHHCEIHPRCPPARDSCRQSAFHPGSSRAPKCKRSARPTWQRACSIEGQHRSQPALGRDITPSPRREAQLASRHVPFHLCFSLETVVRPPLRTAEW
jgi:hypothetical protein